MIGLEKKSSVKALVLTLILSSVSSARATVGSEIITEEKEKAWVAETMQRIKSCIRFEEKTIACEVVISDKCWDHENEVVRRKNNPDGVFCRAAILVLEQGNATVVSDFFERPQEPSNIPSEIVGVYQELRFILLKYVRGEYDWGELLTEDSKFKYFSSLLKEGGRTLSSDEKKVLADALDQASRSLIVEIENPKMYNLFEDLNIVNSDLAANIPWGFVEAMRSKASKPLFRLMVLYRLLGEPVSLDKITQSLDKFEQTARYLLLEEAGRVFGLLEVAIGNDEIIDFKSNKTLEDAQYMMQYLDAIYAQVDINNQRKIDKFRTVYKQYLFDGYHRQIEAFRRMNIDGTEDPFYSSGRDIEPVAILKRNLEVLISYENSPVENIESIMRELTNRGERTTEKNRNGSKLILFNHLKSIIGKADFEKNEWDNLKKEIDLLLLSSDITLEDLRLLKAMRHQMIVYSDIKGLDLGDYEYKWLNVLFDKINEGASNPSVDRVQSYEAALDELIDLEKKVEECLKRTPTSRKYQELMKKIKTIKKEYLVKQ